MERNNMYKLSIAQWNPFQGCTYDCTYCEKSFKAQAKRQKRRCMKCYEYTPHEHPERLDSALPKTKYLQFIFTVASGDVASCSTEYLNKILDRIRGEEDKTFLIQSKNPKTFQRATFPDNVILGTTIETNRNELYRRHKISNAPLPSKRFEDFLQIEHSQKMITIEPVMDFDKDIMISWMENLNPVMVWLGYDSKEKHSYEPSIEKFKDLYWELGQRGFTVMLKTVRENRIK